MNYSITIAGAFAIAVSFLADQLNIKLPYTNEEVKQSILTFIEIAGLFAVYIGRVRQGDITWYGAKIR